MQEDAGDGEVFPLSGGFRFTFNLSQPKTKAMTVTQINPANHPINAFVCRLLLIIEFWMKKINQAKTIKAIENRINESSKPTKWE